jgi:UDPglucose--hexose-1-phosphate uridylyltransferase
MPELRRDPVTERWVIISEERRGRPSEYRPAEEFAPLAHCPFCPGHEAQTPPTLLSTPGPAGWQTRVFANRFPALRVEARSGITSTELYGHSDGLGAHEVMVESPLHSDEYATMDEAALLAVLTGWQSRVRDLSRDERLAYSTIFKNAGAQSGATLSHPHSQLIATPIVPPAVLDRLDGAARFWRRTGHCVYCAMAAEAERESGRLVWADARALVFCPYAPRVGFECIVLPRRHESRFEWADAETLAGVASAMVRLFGALRTALPRVSYHLAIQSAPLRSAPSSADHWYVEVMPVLSRHAAFEMASGMNIVSTAPETAAAYLRERLPETP